VIRFILVTILALFLQSCATISRTPQTTTPSSEAATVPTTSWAERKIALSHLQQWDLRGKLGITTAQDSGSATLNWQQNHDAFHISLMGPLGASGVTIDGNTHAVRLTNAKGKTFTAANPEQLLAEQTGWRLPISYLKYWAKGLPVPNLPEQGQWDNEHRLQELSQGGWRISYQAYARARGLDLPSRMVIQQPGFRAKLVIYSW